MKNGYWPAALGLVLLGGWPAWGASENHRESLRGLTAVQIRVESLSDEAGRAGLDEKSIEADVGQRLRAAGLRLLTANQRGQESGAPVLYVRVNAKRSYDAPLFAVNVTLALLQDVIAARDSSLRLREAKTWDVGYTRTYTQDSLRQVLGVVGDLVNEFVKDWRGVNSR